MSQSLPAKSTLDQNRRYQDEMVELRVAAVKARWTIRALLAGCCLLAATSAGLGVRLALTPDAPPGPVVSLPVVQRGINPEDPRKLIDEANALQKEKNKKKPVPVKNAGKVKTTLT